MISRRSAVVIATIVGYAGCVTSEAAAKCTRLAFSVNDYGKAGPTRDAKKLLDKYIASWTAERGIKSYRTGKKDVKCELFLDFGFFDEHTCRAEATVCWGGNVTRSAKSTRQPAVSVAKSPAKPVEASPAVTRAEPEKVESKPDPKPTEPAKPVETSPTNGG